MGVKTKTYRPIEFRHVCAIARALLLQAPTMTDADWKGAVNDACEKQGWTIPESDQLSRAFSAVEKALLETMGFQRGVVLPSSKPSGPIADRCWTAHDYRLLADTLKRIAARSAGATALAHNVSPFVAVERIDISEPAALDQFYAEAVPGVRLAALRRFAEVAIVRPPDWDYAAIRNAAPRALRMSECFGCRAADVELHRHHVIQVQHGGSNYIRNLVGLCEACHGDVHPWLPRVARLKRGDWSGPSEFIAAVGIYLGTMCDSREDAS